MKYTEIKQLKRFLENNPIELKQLQEKYDWVETIHELVFVIKHLVDLKPICEYDGCCQCKSFSRYNKSGYSDGCSLHAKKVTFLKKYGVENPFALKSIQEKLKKTNIEKYGVDNPMKNKIVQEKLKKTNIEKYGVDNPMKNKIVQEKLKKTNIEKYGVSYIGASPSVQSKKIQTMQSRYGVSYPLQNKKFKMKSMSTLNEHYGVDNPLQSHAIQQKVKVTIFAKYGVTSINKIKNMEFWKNLDLEVLKAQMAEYTITYLAQKYNVFPSTLYSLAKEHSFQTISLYTNELIVEQFLKETNTNYKKNDRVVLHGKELDYFISDSEFAIEINGNYWHSNISGKPDNYHLSKTNKCLSQNISLFHFFEDEFIQHESLVLKYIKHQIINTATKVKYSIPYSMTCINDFISSHCLETYMLKTNADFMVFSLDSIKPITIINYTIVGKTMEIHLIVTDTDYKLDYDSLNNLIFQELKQLKKIEVSLDRRFIDCKSINESKLQVLRLEPPIKWDLDKSFIKRTKQDNSSIHYICDSGIAQYEVTSCQ